MQPSSTSSTFSAARATALPPTVSAPAFTPGNGLDLGSFLQVLGAWLWLPQAALLAWAVQNLSQGVSATTMVWPASGLAASVMAEQAEAVVPWLVRYQPARWGVVLVLPVIAIAVATVSWVAALVLVFAAPLIPLFMALVGWRAKAASEAHMLELGGLNAILLDRLRGLSTLRALGAVDATALRLRDAAQALRQRTMAVLRIAFLSSAVLELFAALGVAMVAVYIGFHLLGTLEFGAWGRQLSLGEGLFVLLLSPAFFEPLRELSAAWHDRAAGQAALEALEQLGRAGQALPGALVATSAETIVPLGALSVALHDVHFAHGGTSAAVVQGCTLHITAGEHVALVGPSGSGKTTLLSLIAGLVAPDQGTLAIGGVPLTAATASTLRQRMARMGQRPHVFAGTVQANLSLGRTGVTRSQVEAAMQWAALGDVAQAHPGSTLGEGGSGLSGGEAVRLALARVAAHPQAGLLLVDEPTAHLDSETAQRVIDALLQLAEGKTLIVATHDPILVARLGRVVQVGGPVAEEQACVAK